MKVRRPRLLPWLLLATLAVFQVALASHHTCTEGDRPGVEAHGQLAVDAGSRTPEYRSPFCLACASALCFGALSNEPAVCGTPSVSEERVPDHACSEESPALFGALLPRPPPPVC